MTLINIPGGSKWQILTLCSLEMVLMILYVFFVRYAEETEESNTEYSHKYPLFQDVHVMIFVGFGFLMTFLKRYGYSAVGFNLLTAAILIQFAILCNGFYEFSSDRRIHVDIKSLMEADIAVACVLISMGVVLGKTTYLQLILMGFIELILYASNKYLCVNILKAADAGESMYVHAFGAYFGLAVSWALRPKTESSATDNGLQGPSYTSDLFSMIGTVFLWMFWPSFNAGDIVGDDKHRAIINTYLSLAACTVATYVTSGLMHSNRKFAMEHIQNATLAGGVAVGTVANLMIHPYGALFIGYAAGTLSVLGFHYVSPWLASRLNIHDTCGVNNLHGMPGIMAGLLGILMAAIATESDYEAANLYEIWPARAPPLNSPDAMLNIKTVQVIKANATAGNSRTASEQALYQLFALGVSVLIALVTGYITGVLINNRPRIGIVATPELFSDEKFWVLPDVEEGIVQESQEPIGKIFSIKDSIPTTVAVATFHTEQLGNSSVSRSKI